MSYKAMQYMTLGEIDYAPGEIIPGASSFPNLKELIEHRFICHEDDNPALQFTPAIKAQMISEIKEQVIAEIKEQVIAEIIESIQSKTDTTTLLKQETEENIPEPIGEVKDNVDIQRGSQRNTKRRG